MARHQAQQRVRTEARGDGGDGTGVCAIRRDASVAVQEVFKRNADVVEPDAAIVDTIQAHLWAVVLDAHPRRDSAHVVANAHHEDVWALVLAADCELRKDSADLHTQPSVLITSPRVA